jgi:threonine/homoserine/homoserine lactone efflux protein
MGEAVAQIIPLGIAVAFSPLPVIAVVLILATPAGRVNALSFAAGGLAAVVVITALATVVLGAAGADEGSGEDPSTWVSVGRLVLGALLLRFAAGQWRARPRAGDPPPELPRWMRTIDTLGPGRAARMGVLLCGVNPKNLILILAAAAAIAAGGGSTADQAAALAVFTVLAMLGVALPIAGSVLLGERADAVLERLRSWMVRESTTIVAVIVVLIAAKLVVDGVSGLVG